MVDVKESSTLDAGLLDEKLLVRVTLIDSKMDVL